MSNEAPNVMVKCDLFWPNLTHKNELAGKYNNKKLDEAIEELNFDGEIGDMTRGELYVLKEYLSTVDQIELLKVPAEVGAGQYGR